MMIDGKKSERKLLREGGWARGLFKRGGAVGWLLSFFRLSLGGLVGGFWF
jgi:hypothetical protein